MTLISSVKLLNSVTWCRAQLSATENECVTKSLLPILLQYWSCIVFSAMVNVFDSEANNYNVYLFPPNFPSSNSLCGRGDGGEWKLIIFTPANLKSSRNCKHAHSVMFTLSASFSLWDNQCFFVDKDRNLCYAAFGWSCRTPCRLSAKWLSYIEKNGILVAVTPPQLLRIIAGYNICVDTTQAQTQVDNTIHTVYVR